MLRQRSKTNNPETNSVCCCSAKRTVLAFRHQRLLLPTTSTRCRHRGGSPFFASIVCCSLHCISRWKFFDRWYWWWLIVCWIRILALSLTLSRSLNQPQFHNVCPLHLFPLIFSLFLVSMIHSAFYFACSFCLVQEITVSEFNIRLFYFILSVVRFFARRYHLFFDLRMRTARTCYDAKFFHFSFFNMRGIPVYLNF